MTFYYPFHVMEKMFKSFPRYEAQTSGEEINSNDYYNLVKVISSETELSEVDVDNAIKHVINQKQGRCSIDDIVENSEDEFGIHHNLIVDEATLFQGNRQINHRIAFRPVNVRKYKQKRSVRL